MNSMRFNVKFSEHNSQFNAKFGEIQTVSGSGSGEPGGYYIPVVTQPTDNTMQVAYSRSDSSLPSVNPVTVTLPEGPNGEDGAVGPQGVQGPKGEAGYTPVKGTDYWTPADKTEMVNDVLAALPVYNGEVEDA